jgi:hypothetical protein
MKSHWVKEAYPGLLLLLLVAVWIGLGTPEKAEAPARGPTGGSWAPAEATNRTSAQLLVCQPRPNAPELVCRAPGRNSTNQAGRKDPYPATRVSST